MHQLPAEGGIDIARGLHDQLKKLGYSVFIDHEGLRAGAFNHALYQEIENCDVFLLVLSRDSLDRCRHKNDWVRQELAHAIRCRKNIVPVMKEGFRFPANLPDDIEQIRFCQALRISYDFYDAFLKKLEEYIWSTPVPLESGGKLYYVMEYRSGNGPTAPSEIWRADMDGRNNELVCTLDSTDLEVLAVNSIGDKLYLQVLSGGRDSLWALAAGADELTLIYEYR